MKTFVTREERGQTLIWVALGFIALIALVALAIDGGGVYATRRQMQNAADAGALAGARELCLGHTASQAQTAANDYAVTQNKAQSALVSVNANGGGVIGGTVTVTATKSSTMFFAGLIGVSSFNVPAVAAAVCGKTTTGCGFMPIAFSVDQWQPIATACPAEHRFYVWAGDQAAIDGTPTPIPTPGPTPTIELDNQGCPVQAYWDKKVPDCTRCDCDVDNLGYDQFISLHGRAWLDFTSVLVPDPILYPNSCGSSNGCGAAELKCWINTPEAQPIDLPKCISGDTGVKAGTHNAIQDASGSIRRVPLYDTVGCSPEIAKGGCSDTFNVIGFGCVKIWGWSQNLRLDWKTTPTPEPGQTPFPSKCYQGQNNKCWQGKAIEVSVKCGGCQTYCGRSNGATPQPGELVSVSLIK